MVSTRFYRNPMDDKDEICDYALFSFGDPKTKIKIFGQRMMTSNYCSTTREYLETPC
jgi:hypothetical protein